MHTTPSSTRPAPSSSLDLRVGVVHKGAISLQQRVPLTGPLVVGLAGVGSADAPLALDVVDGRVSLQVGRRVKVRLGRGGAVRRLELQPSSPPLVLHPADQVRVDVGASVVLLQLVHAVSAPTDAPIDVSEFRPLLLEPGDPLFLGLVSFWGAVACALLVVAAMTPPTELEAPIDPPERILVVLRPPPEAPAPEPPQVVDEAPPVQVAQAAPEPQQPLEPELLPERVDPGPDGPPSDRAAIDRVVRKSKVLGTLGLVAANLTDRSYEEELARALTETTFTDPLAERGPRPGLIASKGGEGRLHAGLPGGLVGGGGRGGTREVEATPEPKKVAPREREATVGIPRSLPIPKGVLGKVRGVYSRHLQQCYQQRLNARGDLRGRVELSFDVEGGRVVVAVVTANETGDDQLATCLENATSRWHFDTDEEGAFTLPMVFEAE